jgi:hypothetical protein
MGYEIISTHDEDLARRHPIGAFEHAETRVHFDYWESTNPWHRERGLIHVIDVGGRGELRYGVVRKTVADIAVDEDGDRLVLEHWDIRRWWKRDSEVVFYPLTHEEARERMTKAWYGPFGKHAGETVPPGFDPAGNEPGEWAWVAIPLDWIAPNERGERYDGTVDIDRAMRYAEAKIEAEVTLGYRGNGAWARVIDGGHRVSAARIRGDKTIPAIMKMRSLKALLELH